LAGEGIRLTQDTAFPEEEGTTLTLQAESQPSWRFHIRVPYWAAKGATVTLNGAPQAIHAKPSTYITLNRQWKTGDKVEVHLPMSLHTAPLPDDRTLQAAMYGPAGACRQIGQRRLTQEMIYGRYGPRMKPGPARRSNRAAKIPRIGWSGRRQACVSHGGAAASDAAVPLYQIFGEKYVVYWKVTGATA